MKNFRPNMQLISSKTFFTPLIPLDTLNEQGEVMLILFKELNIPSWVHHTIPHHTWMNFFQNYLREYICWKRHGTVILITPECFTFGYIALYCPLCLGSYSQPSISSSFVSSRNRPLNSPLFEVSKHFRSFFQEFFSFFFQDYLKISESV